MEYIDYESSCSNTPAAAAAVSNDPKLPGVEVLYDLALKRYDFLSKAYDTANTRVGVVFAFSSLVITSSLTTLKEMRDQRFYEWIIIAVSLLLIVVFVALAICCLFAYQVRDIWLLPNARNLYQENADQHKDEVKAGILYNRIEPLGNARYEAELEKKTRLLHKAIWLLVIEVGLVFVFGSFPYLPHRSWHMSKPDAPPKSEAAPVVDIKAAPPPQRLPEPRLVKDPPELDSRQICLERDHRGVRTLVHQLGDDERLTLLRRK